MNFEWALSQLREGNTVTRALWQPGNHKVKQCCWYGGGFAVPVLRFMYSHRLGAEDLEAQDWQLAGWQNPEAIKLKPG